MQTFGKAVVAGGSGFIGRSLVAALKPRSQSIIVLTRDPERAARTLGADVVCRKWFPHSEAGLIEILDGASAVFNLCGEGIADHRWTAEYKKRLRDSRLEPTSTLVSAMASCSNKPPVLINASGINYYGPRGDERIDESAAPGTSFLADLCVRWEVAAQRAEEYGVRVVRVRNGMVLSAHGGALPRMLLPFKLFVGAPVGSGRQGVSWVHLDDAIGLLLHAATNTEVSGPLNCTTPDPVSNRAFSKALGRALHRPVWMPVPGFMLRLMYGELATELLLEGAFIEPARALTSGYQFRFPRLGDALSDLLG